MKIHYVYYYPKDDCILDICVDTTGTYVTAHEHVTTKVNITDKQIGEMLTELIYLGDF